MGSYNPKGNNPVINNSNTNPAIVQENLDTVVDSVVIGTSKSAGVDWFVTDISFDVPLQTSDSAATCRCDFIFSDNDAQISYTFDGTNYGFLNEGDLLIQDSLYTIEFGAEHGNNFNIKASANVTIQKCTVAIVGKQDIL